MNCKTLSLETIPARLEDIIVAGIALERDPGLQITGMAGLEDARAGQIGFLSNSHHAASLAETKASGRPCPPGFIRAWFPTGRQAFSTALPHGRERPRHPFPPPPASIFTVLPFRY